MSTTENSTPGAPRPKRTAQPDAGAKYEVSVTALVAATLSKNEDVENYYVFTNLKEAHPFDDVVAKVFFKGQDIPYAFAMQLKHIGRGETLDVDKYQNGYNKIHDAGGFKTIEKIAIDNINFCYFCIDKVRTKQDYKLRTYDPPSESWRSALSFENCHIMSHTKPINKTNGKRDDFLDIFYLYLNQSDAKIEEQIKFFCKISDTIDLLKYVERFFENDVLWERGLCKEVFDTELLKIRLSEYIVPPTGIIPLRDLQTAAWNKLTLQHNVTIVEAEINIEKSLYGCLAQMLNFLLNDVVDWNECKRNDLDSTVIREFKKFFATGGRLRVRHWIKAPSTLKSLFVELWKLGEVPLILKAEGELIALKDYTHLNKNFIIITDDLVRRREEVAKLPLRIFTHISDINTSADCVEMRDKLLKAILISFHGRKPVTLYNSINLHEELTMALSCSHILHLMKSRKAYLSKDCVECDYNAIFLIEDTTYSGKYNIDTINKIGGTTMIWCRSADEVSKYRKQIEETPKLQSYTIYHCAASPESKNFTLIEGNKSLVRDFFVDQYSERIYNIDNDVVPILGQNFRSPQQNYIPRSLCSAVISKSFFFSQTKGVCFLSGDLSALDVKIKKRIKEMPLHAIDKSLKTSNETKFIYVRSEDVDEYWEKALELDHPLLHVLVRGANMELCQSKNWANLSEHISYSGRKIPEDSFLEEITNGITLVTGEPGIGKSSLLRSLFKNHGPEKYILFYNLVDYKMEKEIEELPINFSIDVIFSKFKNTRYDEFLSRLLERKERLLVLLDSFDEVLPNQKEKTLNFIRNLAASNVTIIIASRLIANNILMDNFQTQIFKVDILEANDREEYIKSCNLNGKDLTTVPLELVENPLYLNLLKTISEKNIVLANITKLTLFENIINIKLNQYFESNFSSDCDISDKEYLLAPVLELHRKLALVRILGADVVGRWLKWKYEEKVQNKLKLGIILYIDADGYPTFVHETFAEYLTADWITSNIKKPYSQDIYEVILKQDKLYVLDILCEHLELHKAVINEDMKRIALCAQERSHLEKTDALGRTALHMSAACFKRSSYRYFFLLYSSIDILIHNMRELNVKFAVCDDLMRWNWIQYLNCGNVINLIPCYDLSMSVIEAYVKGIVEKIQNGVVTLNVGDRLASQIKQTYAEAMEISSINLIRDLFFVEDATLNGISKAFLHRHCQLLEADTLNLKRIRGFSPLHIACIHGNIEVVRQLIKLKHDVNIIDDFGCTPLHYSIINPPDLGTDMTKLLLDNDSNIDIVNHRDDTATIIAVRSGNLDIVRLLLQKGASINSTQTGMQILLFLALERGDRNMTALLLEHQADANSFNEDGEYALQFLFNSMKYDAELVKLLLDKGADINYPNKSSGRTALAIAAAKGNLDGMTLLLKYGADIEGHRKHDLTPLLFVCQSKKEREELFLRSKKGSDFNTAITATPKSPMFDVVKMLLDEGANVNSTSRTRGETPLMLASGEGYLDIVKLLLEKGADVNSTSDITGETPLILACRSGYLDIVKLLLKKGADVSSTTRIGDTPIILASRSGHLNTVKFLLEKGANVNSTSTIRRETPLMSASAMGYLDIVTLLLKKGANVNTDAVFGLTPLVLAVIGRHFDVARLLIKKGADVSSEALSSAICMDNLDTVRFLLEEGANPNLMITNYETLLMLAINQHKTDFVNILLEKGVDVNTATKKGETALMSACANGNSILVEVLLKKGASVNSTTITGETPLTFASTNDNVNLNVVKLLLENGANINCCTAYGYTPFMLALESHRLDIVNLLLEKGAEINCTTYNDTPLTLAIRLNDSDKVKLLLESRTDANSPTLDGNTPLMIASRFRSKPDVKELLSADSNQCIIERRNLDIVKLLLEYGADMNSTTINGETALLYACAFGNSDVAKLLVENGANVNSKTIQGETPLSYAVRYSEIEIMELLLENDADINSTTMRGETPLHYTSQIGRSDVVKLLIENGANVNDTTIEGRTPLAIAFDSFDSYVVQLLLEAGANIDNITTSSETNTEILLKYIGKCDNVDVVRFILEKGVNVNTWTRNRIVPLVSAIELGNTNVAKLLIEKGADVNRPNPYRKTPLVSALNFVSAETGYSDVVKLLLEKGAKVNVRVNGFPPLYWACMADNSHIIELLLEKGAYISKIIYDRAAAEFWNTQSPK